MLCTLSQWILHIVAVGGLCLPTNEYSKGGELLATGQLSLTNRSLNAYSDKLCLLLYSLVHQTKGLSFYKCHRFLGTCLKTDTGPRAYPTYYLQHNSALFRNLVNLPGPGSISLVVCLNYHHIPSFFAGKPVCWTMSHRFDHWPLHHLLMLQRMMCTSTKSICIGFSVWSLASLIYNFKWIRSIKSDGGPHSYCGSVPQ